MPGLQLRLVFSLTIAVEIVPVDAPTAESNAPARVFLAPSVTLPLTFSRWADSCPMEVVNRIKKEGFLMFLVFLMVINGQKQGHTAGAIHCIKKRAYY